jgi:hypothetical protein
LSAPGAVEGLIAVARGAWDAEAVVSTAIFVDRAVAIVVDPVVADLVRRDLWAGVVASTALVHLSIAVVVYPIAADLFRGSFWAGALSFTVFVHLSIAVVVDPVVAEIDIEHLEPGVTSVVAALFDISVGISVGIGIGIGVSISVSISTIGRVFGIFFELAYEEIPFAVALPAPPPAVAPEGTITDHLPVARLDAVPLSTFWHVIAATPQASPLGHAVPAAAVGKAPTTTMFASRLVLDTDEEVLRAGGEAVGIACQGLVRGGRESLPSHLSGAADRIHVSNHASWEQDACQATCDHDSSLCLSPRQRPGQVAAIVR